MVRRLLGQLWCHNQPQIGRGKHGAFCRSLKTDRSCFALFSRPRVGNPTRTVGFPTTDVSCDRDRDDHCGGIDGRANESGVLVDTCPGANEMTRDELKQHLSDMANGLSLMADCDAKDIAVAEVLTKLREALGHRTEIEFLVHCQSFDPHEALLRREHAARVRRVTGELPSRPS